MGLDLGLWSLMPLSTIFQLYIVADSFIDGGGNLEYPEKTTAKTWVMNLILNILNNNNPQNSNNEIIRLPIQW